MKKSEFQETLQKELIDFKTQYQFLPSINENKNWQYFEFADNLYPGIKHSFLHYAYENAIPFHGYANHVRSSQVFGINLFFPLLSSDSEKNYLLKVFKKIVNMDKLEITNYWFEFIPEKDFLGEWRNPDKIQNDYVTSTDIAIEITDSNNKKYIVLIEIKLSEKEFSPCNGYTSRGNTEDIKKYCENFSLLKEKHSNCYLATEHPKKSKRKYFEYFNLKNEFEIDSDIKCPFISNHQCLRNHAFARALRINDKYDKAFFGLVCHDGNEDIMEEFQHYYNLLTEKPQKEIFMLKASEIVKNAKDKIYKDYFSKRYNLR